MCSVLKPSVMNSQVGAEDFAGRSLPSKNMGYGNGLQLRAKTRWLKRLSQAFWVPEAHIWAPNLAQVPFSRFHGESTLAWGCLDNSFPISNFPCQGSQRSCKYQFVFQLCQRLEQANIFASSCPKLWVQVRFYTELAGLRIPALSGCYGIIFSFTFDVLCSFN